MTSALTQAYLHKALHSSNGVLYVRLHVQTAGPLLTRHLCAQAKSRACLASVAVVKVFYTTPHVP